MKKSDFIRILNLVIDCHTAVEKDMLKAGEIDKKGYQVRSSTRNNFAIDLEWFLDKEGFFEN